MSRRTVICYNTCTSYTCLNCEKAISALRLHIENKATEHLDSLIRLLPSCDPCCMSTMPFLQLASLTLMFLALVPGFGAYDEEWTSKNLLNTIIGMNDTVANLKQTPEIITHYGYPVEHHLVTSRNDYKLMVYRVPHGITEASKRCTVREPVILHHGLVSSSSDWVMQEADRNLPFILAENCFDVWLANARGTSDSLGHPRFDSEKDTAYWDFSIDDLGKYDVPSIIDYVLETSGGPGDRFKKLTWVGHSMGTTVLFICMHYHPQYNERVRKMVALSPVAYVGNLYSPGFRAMTVLPDPLLEILVNTLFKGRFSPQLLSTILKAVAPQLCPLRGPISELSCASVLHSIAGSNPSGQSNATVLSRVVSHTPQTTSVRIFTHCLQLARSGRFESQKRYLSGLDPLLGPVLQPIYGRLPNLDGIVNPIVSGRSAGSLDDGPAPSGKWFTIPGNPGIVPGIGFPSPWIPTGPVVPQIPGVTNPIFPQIPGWPNPFPGITFPNPVQDRPTEGGFRPDVNAPPYSFFPSEKYDLNKTVIPIFFIFAKDDSIATPKDCLRTISEIGTRQEDKKLLMVLQCDHLDLMYADDSKSRLFNRIKNYLKAGDPVKVP